MDNSSEIFALILLVFGEMKSLMCMSLKTDVFDRNHFKKFSLYIFIFIKSTPCLKGCFSLKLFMKLSKQIQWNFVTIYLNHSVLINIFKIK